ncbi:MAG TPA: hypothetical protein VMU05_04675 [Dongiaceae bacterium]|nr:hypothetical protein [Dongiaceae bacterium]
MSNVRQHDAEVVISAVFCELYTATNAVRVLNQIGFKDGEVDVIGVLSGSVPDFACLLQQSGLPAEQAGYYADWFDQGAVLVMVRAEEWIRQKAAAAVLKLQGGMLAPGTE